MNETSRTDLRIDRLCGPHADRHVGGEGDRSAREFFVAEAEGADLRIERIGFEALEWLPGSGASLTAADGFEMPLRIGPFSAGVDASGPLVAVDDVGKLEAVRDPGAILLLHGAIAAEQYVPRHYPFYSVAGHARVLDALDAARPAAIIAATGRTPMAAGLYPFPLFEDGDLGWPSAYIRDVDAAQLLALAGCDVRVRIDSSTRLLQTEQLIAHAGPPSGPRVIVSAHIDSRYGTPGALDNAAGVATLLALADRFAKTPPPVHVELVPFNGEDDYAAPGELAYLARPGALDDVAVAVNVDAVGRRGDTTAISFYSAGEELKRLARSTAAHFERIAEGDSWPMSDHMVFAMRGVPAIAVTSSGLMEISATVAHTADDVPALVDPTLVDETARYIEALIAELPAAIAPSPSPAERTAS